MILSLKNMTHSISLPFKPGRIVVSHILHREIVDYLRQRRTDLDISGGSPESLADIDLNGVDVLIGFKRPAHAHDMGSVRWVHSSGAGVDGWLGKPALDESILLTRSPELFGVPIAEWVAARILAMQQQILPLYQDQQQSRWLPREIGQVAGSRAVLVGAGDTGRGIAKLLAALNIECVGVSRSGVSSSEHFAEMHTPDSLPELVRHCNWLITCVPDTVETRGMISREVLAQCHNVSFINCGRGSVVDESAIPEALDRGWLKAVALDVFQKEPLPADSPLWKDDRVMISPHISGLTTAKGAAEGFLECLGSLEHGEIPRWAIDRSRQY